MQKSNIKTSSGIYHCSECGERILKSHKEVYNCSICELIFCGRHVFSYVDGNNKAITKHSPLRCANCIRKSEEQKLDAIIKLTDLFPDNFKLKVLKDISKFV